MALLRRSRRRYEILGNVMGFMTFPGVLFIFFFGAAELTALMIAVTVIWTASQIALVWSDIKCRQIEAKMRRMRRDTVRRYQFHD